MKEILFNMKNKTCKKKKFDLLGAKLALATAKNQQRLESRYYFCKFCKAYHLTSQPKRIGVI